MTDTLLPCPFNRTHNIECFVNANGLTVRCNICEYEVPHSTWNTRTPSSTRANERGDFDWAEMQRYLEEGADEPDWDASWVIDRVRTYIAANTPQPSPQSDMVAVPRVASEKMLNAAMKQRYHNSSAYLCGEKISGVDGCQRIYTAMISAAGDE